MCFFTVSAAGYLVPLVSPRRQIAWLAYFRSFVTSSNLVRLPAISASSEDMRAWMDDFMTLQSVTSSGGREGGAYNLHGFHLGFEDILAL